ncbi:hypothetical protein M8845_15230 [Gelidibacter japonicus]|nr:hypothetical protein [Gelidibacter japonicus]MCL8008781.1 hypothetical protein [Gelidibacter japonicus]
MRKTKSEWPSYFYNLEQKDFPKKELKRGLFNNKVDHIMVVVGIEKLF